MELTSTDQVVLKAAGEHGIERDRQGVVSFASVTEKVAAQGVNEEECARSTHYLVEHQLIEGRRLPTGEWGRLIVTWRGMETHLRRNVPDYQRIEAAIEEGIVRGGLRTNDELAQSVGQPRPIIDHVLDKLQQDREATVHGPFYGGRRQVFGVVSETLKRRVERR